MRHKYQWQILAHALLYGTFGSLSLMNCGIGPSLWFEQNGSEWPVKSILDG